MPFTLGFGWLEPQGADMVDFWIVTTPGVPHLTKHQYAGLDLIALASHNPAKEVKWDLVRQLG